MAHRTFLFAGWIRLWHWCNLLFFLGLTLSGLILHFSPPKVGILDYNLAQRIHNIFGVALAVSYLFFVVANFATGNWKQFVPRFSGFLGQAIRQTRYYLFDIFFGRPAPFPTTAEDHFNPLQKLIYLIVMYVMMPVLIITGLMYLWPEMAPDRLFGLDGLLPVAMLHYIVAYLLILFMCAHVYLCTCGSSITAHFKAMITGWHEE